MSKEFRNPKSEAVPRTGPPSAVSPHKLDSPVILVPALPSADGFPGFLAVTGLLNRHPSDTGFGLRTSGFFRHSEFGFEPSLFHRNPRFMMVHSKMRTADPLYE